MAPKISSSTDSIDRRTSTRVFPRRGLSASRLIIAALTCALSVGNVFGAGPQDNKRAALRDVRKRGPVVVGKIPNYKVNQCLSSGFRNALRRIHHIPSCQGLFDSLGANGIEVLGNSTYTLAREDWEQQVCKDSNAFVVVGSTKVRLCGAFGWLSEADAAKVLIHEALHSAGLGEYPQDPDGPTAAEIDEMVKKHCGF